MYNLYFVFLCLVLTGCAGIKPAKPISNQEKIRPGLISGKSGKITIYGGTEDPDTKKSRSGQPEINK